MIQKEFRTYTVADYRACKPAVYRNGQKPAEITVVDWITISPCLYSINSRGAVIMHVINKEEENNWDLVIEREKKEYWVNLFRISNDVVMVSSVMDSREHALNIRKENSQTITYIGDPVKVGEEYI